MLVIALGLRVKAQSGGADCSTLLCTEVCVANIDQVVDYSNNYGGWVELYNPTSTAVALDGWYVSDDEEMLAKHRLTGYGVLNPESYRCVFFDHNAADGQYGPDAVKQVRFKLNRKGGTLYLSRNGKDVDLCITYPASMPRCSYARAGLDADVWMYCGMPTPGKANAGHYAEECLPLPEVDVDSKVFTSGFDVHVPLLPGTLLRFTTDGSAPTLTNGATSADGLFSISQTTVLRLRMFSDDKLPSGVVTRTYIRKDKDYYLPIVAIATNRRNLYDDKIGCYVDGTNGVFGRGSEVESNLNMDWERPVNFEYLTAEGEMVVNQETCFEVVGGYSRHFKPASFKVKAQKLYDGNDSFDYPVFARKPYCKYEQLLIRNGGNNNRTDGGPRIKDAITQQVLTLSDYYVDAQEYQPVHVFVNGKYLAMMNLREPNNRYHGCANYGYDEDEMDGFEYSNGGYQQRGGDREAFDRLLELSENADTKSGYAEVGKLLDIDEFVRYMAAVCYTSSYDWILNNNNVKGYRSWANGKFHFVLFDQDLTWERTNNVEAIEGVRTNELLVLYNNLKRNADFCRQFVVSYCILHGSVYTPERCQYVADSICGLVKTALSFDRRQTSGTYYKMRNEMWGDAFRQARMQSLKKVYRLTDELKVNIAANIAMSRIRVEGQDLPYNSFSGVLFGATNVTAESAEGYEFVGWQDQNGKMVSHDKDYRITKGGTYTAVFDKSFKGDVSPICINEVSAANDIYVNDCGKRADWVELYNRGAEPVDVSDWFFSNDEGGQEKYQVEANNGVSTVINPNEHMVIWCDGNASESQLHLPFKLKNDDNGILIIQSADGLMTDTLRYDKQSSKETVGRFPDGGDCFRVFYRPTIGGDNMTTTYDSVVNAIPNTSLSPTLSGEVESVNYYTVSGILTDRPSYGIYIKVVRYKNGKTNQSKVFLRSSVLR